MKARNPAIVLLATALLAGCSTGRRVHDLTTNISATCKVHHLPMTQKRVAEASGMRVRLNPMDLVRPELFPHADEAYDTRACMKCHKYARIWVCAKCSEARIAWMGGQARRH